MLARAGKRPWQAFSTCPVAPHARRGDPPTVDLLVEVSDNLLHLSIDCIDAQADLQLIERELARTNCDRPTQTRLIQTHPSAPSMVERWRNVVRFVVVSPTLGSFDVTKAIATMGAIATRVH